MASRRCRQRQMVRLGIEVILVPCEALFIAVWAGVEWFSPFWALHLARDCDLLHGPNARPLGRRFLSGFPTVPARKEMEAYKERQSHSVDETTMRRKNLRKDVSGICYW
ncbi:hypothetical protein CRG98_006818 [Punica granatum]|uniref:Uncharacterized protein n=1 Tax=Punica granatum TaxID=22663 RepID=A0A2I0KWF6_PUNGR|nr:hypothetical protein CRG98_006818 [Punica granatum]